MFSIWQSVQVTNPNHPRGNKSGDPAQAAFGQAGTVQGINPADPAHVGVKFDTDGVTELVAVADLRAL